MNGITTAGPQPAPLGITHDQRHRVALLAEHGVDIVSSFTKTRSPRRGTPIEVALSYGARAPHLSPGDAFVGAALAGDTDAVRQTPADVVAAVRHIPHPDRDTDEP